MNIFEMLTPISENDDSEYHNGYDDGLNDKFKGRPSRYARKGPFKSKFNNGQYFAYQELHDGVYVTIKNTYCHPYIDGYLEGYKQEVK